MSIVAYTSCVRNDQSRRDAKIATVTCGCAYKSWDVYDLR